MASGASDHQLAYAAGLFDGEGHIAIVHRKARPLCKTKSRYERYCLHVSMSQNNAAAIRWLHEIFGGSCRKVTGKRSYDGGTYDRWNWALSTNQARDFLLGIQVYSIVKQDEIALALEFQSSMMVTGRAKLPTNVVEFRRGCFERIRQMRGSQQK